MALIRPESLSEALAALNGAPIPLIAGGTDFYPARQGRPLPADALDLTGIADLQGIAHDGAGWRIGAATTWTQIAHADLPPAFDGLRAAAREVGSIQIQNAGTIAGNLCNASPAADGVPPLLTLDAVVECASATGLRRIALSDFILGPRRTALGPAEIVTALLIPDASETARATFVKLGSRRYLVISIAMVAAVVSTGSDGRIEGARIAVGACSPVARRLPGVEAALLGRPLSDGLNEVEITADMLSPLSPIGDVRAPAAYRLEAAAELIRRALRGIAEDRHG
ncbi:FAD binding domain-containing protein [Albidovulum sediminicola]|uniref:Xanthine dehydrogenase family protein subunit M n=1 Tax=Albidovulum sediminicola TaxID=2984331 RepID=A0ABT2Z390_9RHOB|nr:xanthine dehydrogenase family protein subunit M [Defluviimonas sp. WL0075]MCV2865614.1 xanthine dehydrogenase family protein subunit M [Defluviimonas sp. WL0075]